MQEVCGILSSVLISPKWASAWPPLVLASLKIKSDKCTSSQIVCVHPVHAAGSSSSALICIVLGDFIHIKDVFMYLTNAARKKPLWIVVIRLCQHCKHTPNWEAWYNKCFSVLICTAKSSSTRPPPSINCLFCQSLWVGSKDLKEHQLSFSHSVNLSASLVLFSLIMNYYKQLVRLRIQVVWLYNREVARACMLARLLQWTCGRSKFIFLFYYASDTLAYWLFDPQGRQLPWANYWPLVPH